MNINRHNYEEYFILYMDNELGSDDRRMVEAFVQQHPDLKEELDILLQYKLEPDASVVFNGKEELIKVNGDAPITLRNYEEWLVLYLDNELTPDRAKTVEQFINDNPAVKQEFVFLQKARLQPETIIFPYKESLYRKEEKPKVVPFPWIRVAAAVLIIALGITSVIVFSGRKSSDVNINENVAKTIPAVKEQQQPVNNNPANDSGNPGTADKQINNQEAIAGTGKEVLSPAIKQRDKNLAASQNKNIAEKNTVAGNPVTNNKTGQQAIAKNDDNNPSNNLPDASNNPNVNKNDATAYTANPSIETNPPQETVITTPVVTYVIPASYKNTDSDASQLEEGSSNKKGRGLLRKIARTFEKRTNMSATDDNRLLVGGLSFKLK